MKLLKINAGFTLVEMMAVVAVFAIMAAVAIPAFMSLLPGMRLNGAARQVMGDLMSARMSAVKENNNFRVHYLSNYTYQIIDDEDKSGTANGGEWTVTKDIRDNYPDGVRFYHSTNNVIFYPRGNASPATLYLETTDGSQKKAVIVNFTGRTKITSDAYSS
jgi:type IV fimbrial biogenesis protein FimT